MKRLEPSQLKSHIGYRMRVVSNAVSHSFARKLAASEVTVAEWVILREMYSSEITTSPSEVAAITGLSRGAVSKLIDRLLAKNLVSRMESISDRRYQEIKLTAKAIQIIPKLAIIADENDNHFFSVLTASERKSLLEILTKLADLNKLNKNPID
ncbi:MarR family winged helix-turn-helix transcriptional regulator [Legionella longbeachae]|uniref:Putative transcriptional regulator, MarR family n=1 Tax=Legionella longbeachae serogroup 1 (strain NSW150) TaxID=661367 RepID=D3HJD9_LEGLN|nr:MarR family transcriptional regulator [Legionella longbeachae]HBD7398753.1 MarR family transcriptional regulator [Legionella pneumophila]ARM32834.1 MarR family transcriptional regulator [Legionella longbeachae]QIN32803.1 MarR family transcriptional regulator [Legionella longbeachae]QIN36108.1 MarR family transcriptional regulator [Legionella longbeachae]CBJ12531.1 putative transcriptional regulator, MarR family [Legionella longbeachae NSW150]